MGSSWVGVVPLQEEDREILSLSAKRRHESSAAAPRKGDPQLTQWPRSGLPISRTLRKK